MIEYATADDKCRSRMLLRYFGERTNTTADNVMYVLTNIIQE